MTSESQGPPVKHPNHARSGQLNHQHQVPPTAGPEVADSALTLEKLLFTWPDIEPDSSLIASARQLVYQEMDRFHRTRFSLNLFPALSFAAGLAVLAAVLLLPLLWMSPSPPATTSTSHLAELETIEIKTNLIGPFGTADPLIVTDPLRSLRRSYRSKIRPGSVVHVIYPNATRNRPVQTVIRF